MADPNALFALAEAVLATCVQALTDAGLDVPARQFVADGDIAVDCGMLAVAVPSLYMGFPGQSYAGPMIKGQSYGRSAELLVLIQRCVPAVQMSGETPIFPAPAAITASAKNILADGWVLFLGLVAGFRSGAFAEFCGDFAFTSAINRGPEGGLSGWEFRVAVQMNTVQSP